MDLPGWLANDKYTVFITGTGKHAHTAYTQGSSENTAVTKWSVPSQIHCLS